jgi:hypothetical protein
MNGAALAVILFAASCLASAADAEAWRDLNVQVEPLAEPILVNGLPLKVTSVTGSDVEVLARRMGDKWISESDAHVVRFESHGSWKIVSRIHGADLEVVQWTGRGKNARLLWSRSELLARIQTPVHGGLRFPPGCVAGRTVSGRIDARSYWQQAASCKGSPRNALSAVRASAGTLGYEVLSRDGQLLARNGNTEITVLAWRSNDGPEPVTTSLVYLQLGPPVRTP